MPAKTGYDQTAPKWDKALTNIIADMAFAGWDKEIVPCTADATYTALFVSLIAKGDVNGDGTVDSSDVIYLLWSRLFGEDVYPLTASGDVNGSGEADNDDVIYLLWYTVYGEAEYPLH